jgi:phenylalanyl-tRNA synthetase alpha chain
MLEDKINKIKSELESINIDSKEELEQFKLNYLTKKSELSLLFNFIKEVSPELRKELGFKINNLKNIAENIYECNKNTYDIKQSYSVKDPTLPANGTQLGGRHPLSIVQNEITEIFQKLGFSLSDGPEVEDDWHNFSALNFPDNHPARDMQDTFFINEEYALRTHTSSVQVRIMENGSLPLRYIMPGRVYRNEAVSARANCFFHQVEGIYIDKNVSFADLKLVLFEFTKQMFNKDVKLRFRPSYFPFTEPSAEMDITCFICSGKGCNICKHSGWVEIMGCGMIDPAVLENNKIDSNVYNGYAFGMGIERITMLKYQINDLRLFFDNDIRMLKQFS